MNNRTSDQLPLFPSADKAPPATARESNRGGLYHLRYAAMEALLLEPGQSLGYESVDDLDIKNADGSSTRTQVKDERATPLTNSNRGLWKALAHWARDARDQPEAFAKIKRLLFVTTAAIPAKSLAHLLADEKSNPQERVDYAIKIDESTASELQRHMKDVRGLPQAEMLNLFGKITIVPESDIDSIRQKMKRRLRALTFWHDSLDEAAEHYYGWFVNRIDEGLDEKGNEGARVDNDVVERFLKTLRDRMTRESRRFTHGETPFDEGLRETYRQRLFVRQLEAIEVDDDDINLAMRDYFRTIAELSDWAKTQVVSKGDLREFDEKLWRTWRNCSHGWVKRPNGLDPVQRGYETFAQVRAHRAPLLNGKEPPSHVHMGFYHKLADNADPPIRGIDWSEPDHRIGWHPEWKTMFPRKP